MREEQGEEKKKEKGSKAVKEKGRGLASFNSQAPPIHAQNKAWRGREKGEGKGVKRVKGEQAVEERGRERRKEKQKLSILPLRTPLVTHVFWEVQKWF